MLTILLSKEWLFSEYLAAYRLLECQWTIKSQQKHILFIYFMIHSDSSLYTYPVFQGRYRRIRLFKMWIHAGKICRKWSANPLEEPAINPDMVFALMA